MEIRTLERAFIRSQMWRLALAAISVQALTCCSSMGRDLETSVSSSFNKQDIYCPPPCEVRPFSYRGTGIQRYSASDDDDPDFPPVHIYECRLIDNEYHGKECGPPNIGGPQLCAGLHIDSLRNSILERVPVSQMQPCDAGLFKPIEYLRLPTITFSAGTVIGHPSVQSTKGSIPIHNVFAPSAIALTVVSPSDFTVDRGYLSGTLPKKPGLYEITVVASNSRGSAVSVIQIDVVQ